MKRITLVMVLCALCLSVYGCSGKNVDGNATSQVTENVPGTGAEDKEQGKEKESIVTDENGVRFEAEYDERGNIISRTCVDGDSGMYGSRIVYVYNSDGRLFIEIHYDVNGAFEYQNMYEYNAEGVKTQVKKSTEDGKLLGLTEFDGNGKIVKETAYGESETVTFIGEYTYNEAGIRTNEKCKYPGVGISEEKQYDNSGAILKSISYGADDAVTQTVDYSYDEKKLLIEMKTTGADGALIEKRTYEYNENGQKHRMLRYGSNDRVIDQEVYYYDADGKLEKTQKFDADGYEV